MKKLKFLSACAAAAALVCTCFSVNAANTFTEIEGFAFGIRDGGAVIHEYNGSNTEVTVPGKLLGAPVSGIADSAFFGDGTLSSLDLSAANSLGFIGSSAFYGCTSLSEINIPDSVTQIGFGAFRSCTGLRTLALGSGLTEIEAQTFYNCDSLAFAEIPSNITEIGAYAFGGCDSLTAVIIPDSVVSIDKKAFYGSGQLTVYCRSGSYAHAFAEENGVPYILTEQMPKGDMDGDGFVNICDVTMLQMHLAEITKLSGFDRLAADIDGDGVVMIEDATALQMYLSEYDTAYPIGARG